MVFSHWKFILTFSVWKRDIFYCSEIYDYEFMSNQFVLFLTIVQYVLPLSHTKAKKSQITKWLWNPGAAFWLAQCSTVICMPLMCTGKWGCIRMLRLCSKIISLTIRLIQDKKVCVGDILVNLSFSERGQWTFTRAALNSREWIPQGVHNESPLKDIRPEAQSYWTDIDKLEKKEGNFLFHFPWLIDWTCDAGRARSTLHWIRSGLVWKSVHWALTPELIIFSFTAVVKMIEEPLISLYTRQPDKN